MQPRFTKGSLCQTVLTSSFDKIIGFPDKGNLVDLIYLEFNKAFDMGPHGKLLVRLEKMRINRTREWGEPGLVQKPRRDRDRHGKSRIGERMRVGVRRACPEAGPGEVPPSLRLGVKFPGFPGFPAATPVRWGAGDLERWEREHLCGVCRRATAP